MAGFDAHTHVFPPAQVGRREAVSLVDRTFGELYRDPAARLATGPELLSALDEAGIGRAVAAGFAFSRERDIAEQNEYLVGFAAESAGRAVAFVTVNPALPGWQRLLTTAKESGARGIGEIRPRNQGWDPLGADGRALCQAAGELGLVLLWHVSEPLGHEYPGKRGGISPIELVQLAGQFPEVPMVGAHMGGGAAYYLQMPEVRAAGRSLYFDTAAASLLYDDAAIARLAALAGPDRVLFGSDYPLLSPGRQLQHLKGLLPGDIAEAITGGNAETLLCGPLRHD